MRTTKVFHDISRSVCNRAGLPFPHFKMVEFTSGSCDTPVLVCFLCLLSRHGNQQCYGGEIYVYECCETGLPSCPTEDVS